ncbi:hypothetical protein D3C72_2162360 [compost metagenome]
MPTNTTPLAIIPPSSLAVPTAIITVPAAVKAIPIILEDLEPPALASFALPALSFTPLVVLAGIPFGCDAVSASETTLTASAYTTEGESAVLIRKVPEITNFNIFIVNP